MDESVSHNDCMKSPFREIAIDKKNIYMVIQIDDNGGTLFFS